MNKGDILLTRNDSGILNWFIRHLTWSEFTHCAVVHFEQGSQTSVIEASHTVQVVPFKRNYEANPKESWISFRVKGVSQEQIDKALESCWFEYSGNFYGYFQLVWFVWRFICEIFGRDMRVVSVWPKGGQLCSEMLWHYLDRLGDPEINSKIRKWNADAVHVEDFHQLFLRMPHRFEIIERVWRAPTKGSKDAS